MPKWLRRLLSVFIPFRQMRHAFVAGWTNNRIVIVSPDGTAKTHSAFWPIPGVKVRFRNSNNLLRLCKPFLFEETVIALEGDSSLEIGKNPYIKRNLFLIQRSSTVKIGDDFTSEEDLRVVLSGEPRQKVSIGQDCMFSRKICIHPADGHTIFDVSTGQALNPGKEICIGNHVWVGMNVLFLKGARIADNSVVGANSLVTKPFTDPNSIYAGAPAQKRNKKPINWDRKSCSDFVFKP